MFVVHATGAGGASEGSSAAEMKEKERANPDIRFLTLPRYGQVVLF